MKSLAIEKPRQEKADLQPTIILSHSQLRHFPYNFGLPPPTSSSPAIRKSSTLKPFRPPWFFSHLSTDNGCCWQDSTNLSTKEDLNIRSVVVFLLKTARKSPLPVDEHMAPLFGNCLFVSWLLLRVMVVNRLFLLAAVHFNIGSGSALH